MNVWWIVLCVVLKIIVNWLNSFCSVFFWIFGFCIWFWFWFFVVPQTFWEVYPDHYNPYPTLPQGRNTYCALAKNWMYAFCQGLSCTTVQDQPCNTNNKTSMVLFGFLFQRPEASQFDTFGTGFFLHSLFLSLCVCVCVWLLFGLQKGFDTFEEWFEKKGIPKKKSIFSLIFLFWNGYLSHRTLSLSFSLWTHKNTKKKLFCVTLSLFV